MTEKYTFTKNYIKEYKIPVTKLTGSVEQRLNKVMETIK